MEKAIISLSFDDARKDNAFIFKDILWPRRIPATLNVTTGYVDGTCPKDKLPCLKPAMSIEDIIDLGTHFRQEEKQFFEIALHGDQHLNTETDISAGREKLLDWLDLPKNYVFGFASPGSGLDTKTFMESDSVLFKEQISYLRTSLRITDHEKWRVFFRKVGRVWHRPNFYQYAYANTLMKSCSNRIIYSVPVLKDITEEQVKGLVNLALREKAALTLMFHSIDVITNEDDNWTWDINKFQGLVDYLMNLKEGDAPLELSTTQMLFEKIK